MVSVWRPGFPVLRLFVVYIARAPGNYCTDVTPTRGVWSQIRSLYHNLSRLYGRPDRSAPRVTSVPSPSARRVKFHAFLSSVVITQSTRPTPPVHTDMLPLSRAIRALPTPGAGHFPAACAHRSIGARVALAPRPAPTVRGSRERS